MRYSSWIHREVSEKDAKDYADSIHAIFVETSAKNAININEVFIEISESGVAPLASRAFISVFTMRRTFQISFNIRISYRNSLLWPNPCSCEREKKQGLCRFCHQTYFSRARVSSSPFCCQSSRDPLRYAEAALRSPALRMCN